MEHYYSQNPTSSHELIKISYNLNNKSLVFITDTSVFSRHHVDFGSHILISTLPPLEGNILDLGCGYGAIGISIAYLNRNSNVAMSDINERAVKLAHGNIVLNNIPNAVAFQSNGFQDIKDTTYSTIVSNPPIRAGKKVIYPMFEQSIDYLIPGGCLYIVIQKKQGASSAVEKLKSIYGNCKVINKEKGYWILKSIKV
ncbi:MAG: methyltransferase [Xylanivirga thermophila]|uniref:class I SAM-dependent methyltransferase n=1 Tax=Xylanivirga thermophila TaxID=2496273 RepID=UPI00101D654B|nr:methyltransferase [Xylanivirga thermophila]